MKRSNEPGREDAPPRPARDVIQAGAEALHAVDCGTGCMVEHTPEVWPTYRAEAVAVIAAVAGRLLPEDTQVADLPGAMTRPHPGRPRSEGGAWGSYVDYLDQVETERDWLLAEAPDELRERFFATRAEASASAVPEEEKA